MGARGEGGLVVILCFMIHRSQLWLCNAGRAGNIQRSLPAALIGRQISSSWLEGPAPHSQFTNPRLV